MKTTKKGLGSNFAQPALMSVDFQMSGGVLSLVSESGGIACFRVTGVRSFATIEMLKLAISEKFGGEAHIEDQVNGVAVKHVNFSMEIPEGRIRDRLGFLNAARRDFMQVIIDQDHEVTTAQ